MVKYFFEDTDFKFSGRRLNNFWLKSVASVEARVLGSVNIIFCSDDYLLNINKKYLSHDYYTDIITFDYCEKNILSGDLFISIDSVRDNAGFFNVSFSQELDRVMVHGLLHLIGYDDHMDEDIAVMRSKENCYIELKSKIRENE